MHLKEYLFRCNPEEGTAMWLSLMAIQMFVPSLTLNSGLAMRIAVISLQPLHRTDLGRWVYKQKYLFIHFFFYMERLISASPIPR